MTYISNCILNRIIGGKNLLRSSFAAFPRNFAALSSFFVNYTVQKSKLSENLSPRCKMALWHSLCCRSCPIWQEMSLRTPDPLSAFQGGLGTRLPHNNWVDLSEGEMWYIWPLTHKVVEPLHLFMYVCYCKQVESCRIFSEVQSTVSNIRIVACKHIFVITAIIASSRLYTTEFHM